jgi:hypothetical protein
MLLGADIEPTDLNQRPEELKGLRVHVDNHGS